MKPTMNEIEESDEGIVVMNAENKGRSTELPELRPSFEGKMGDSKHTPYTELEIFYLRSVGKGEVQSAAEMPPLYLLS